MTNEITETANNSWSYPRSPQIVLSLTMGIISIKTVAAFCYRLEQAPI